MTTRIVELRRGILKKNDELAAGLRASYAAARVMVLNLVSSPGTGKTAFLEWTLTELRKRGVRVAALVGDLETDNDARRLASSGAPVRQINTHGICHLDAEMIGKHLDGWELGALDYLFIENVGNLVCPSAFDLGQNANVVLLAVTEGDDKPAKYPVMFRVADLVLLSKSDLLDVLDDFSPRKAEAYLRTLANPATVLQVSARRPETLAPWIAWIEEQHAGVRHSAASHSEHGHVHHHHPVA